MLLGLYTVVPLFCLGMFLELVYAQSWAMSGFGIGGILVFGLAGQLLQRKWYREMPCPQCGATGLAQALSKDSERSHLLICVNCGIEWETGLCSSHST